MFQSSIVIKATYKKHVKKNKYIIDFEKKYFESLLHQMYSNVLIIDVQLIAIKMYVYVSIIVVQLIAIKVVFCSAVY